MGALGRPAGAGRAAQSLPMYDVSEAPAHPLNVSEPDADVSEPDAITNVV